MPPSGLAPLLREPVLMTGFPLGGKAPPWIPMEQRWRRDLPATGGQSSPGGDRLSTAHQEPIDISDVPELREGILKVGSDIAYAPLEFLRDGSGVADGLDVELAKALAQRLGVEARFQDTRFEGIIRALRGKRFDIIMSGMTITDEREKEIEFISYLATPSMGTGILVSRGNPRGVRGLEDLCGLRVAIQKGTVQVEEVKSVICVRGMKINVSTFDRHGEGLEQLKRGRVDAQLADIAVATFEARQSAGELDVVPCRFKYAPYGIGLRKDSLRLREVLAQALKAIKDDGTYDSILKRWV